VLWTRRISGKPPVLVFLHEALGSVAQWRDFPDRLCSATGLAGFLYDRTGHGLSPPMDGPRPLDYLYREAETLHTLLDSESVLVGHSDGATIALIYGATHPVPAIIAESPHIDVEPAVLAGIRKSSGQFPEWKSRLERYHGEKTDALLSAWTDTWLNPEFARFSIRTLLPSLRCPVLAIQGDRDPYATDRQLSGVRELVPHAQIEWIADCGHVPHRERENEVLNLMVSFLERITRAGGGW
jgi:pimeloyl-ACP methyl ester carboxylesterase